MNERILIVEDEPGIIEMLKRPLTELDFQFEWEINGVSGLEKALKNEYSLVILDANLPGMNGFDICRKLRDQKEGLPIIMLTSRAEEVDRILGLELGADDYVTKPFSVRELTSRIKGLLRRSSWWQEQAAQNVAETDLLPPSATSAQEILVFGELQIDPERRLVTYSGVNLDLTATEFDLLYLMALRPGKVFTREELMAEVWEIDAENFEPTVTVTLCRLRCKVEPNPTTPIYIQTIRGVGYRFAEFKDGKPVKY